MKKIVQQSATVFLATLVATVLIWPQGVWSSDLDDLSDAHALGPYDEVACNGATEDELDTGDESNSFFPPFGMSFESDSDDGGGGMFGGGPFGSDGGGSFSGAYEFPFSDEEVFQLFNRDSEEAHEPTVIISVEPTDVQEGQTISARAATSDFYDSGSTDSRKYAVAFSLEETSLQGIVAGGKYLPESPTGSACGLVTRTPLRDEDSDGMDDDWEILYGLNPQDPSDAGADPDGDSASDFFTNAEGESVVISPETAAGPPGVMNNLAEFIWDTDPLRRDTDKDGISDGEEILGFGDNTVQITNDRPVGSTLTFRAFVVGVSSMEDAKNDREKIIKLDANKKTVHVSNGERLQGTVEPEKDFTIPGETVVLQSKFEGTQAEPDSLIYTYVVDDQELENPTAARHRLEYQIDPDEKPGREIPVEIEAINPATGQLAVLRNIIRVGENVLLESNPIQPIATEGYTVHALLPSGNDPTDYLYEWYVDGTLDEQASGVGLDSISLIAPENPGQEVTIRVLLYSVDKSQLMGDAEIEVEVATPEVSIELIPKYPIEGDIVTAIAHPRNFPRNLDTDDDGENDAVVLRYSWVVDRDELPVEENAAGLSTITLDAGFPGQDHLLEVTADALSPRQYTAYTDYEFETLGGANLVTRIQEGTRNVLASLISNKPATLTILALALLIVSGIFGYVFWFKPKKRGVK